MRTNSKTIKELLQAISIGAGINIMDAPAILSYNPHVVLEYTASSPYKLIIHEYFQGKHLKTDIILDDYKGEALEVLPQEIVS